MSKLVHFGISFLRLLRSLLAVIALNFPPKFLLGICLPSYSGRGDSLFLVEQCEFRLVPLVEVTVVVFPKLLDELGEYCITFFRKISRMSIVIPEIPGALLFFIFFRANLTSSIVGALLRLLVTYWYSPVQELLPRLPQIHIYTVL